MYYIGSRIVIILFRKCSFILCTHQTKAAHFILMFSCLFFVLFFVWIVKKGKTDNWVRRQLTTTFPVRDWLKEKRETLKETGQEKPEKSQERRKKNTKKRIQRFFLLWLYYDWRLPYSAWSWLSAIWLRPHELALVSDHSFHFMSISRSAPDFLAETLKKSAKGNRNERSTWKSNANIGKEK